MPSPRNGSPHDDEPHREALGVVVGQRDALLAAIRSETGLDQHAAEDVLSIVTLRVLVNGVRTDPESWFRYMREAARRQACNERRSATRAAARAEAAFLPTARDLPVDAVAARMVWLDALADLAQLPELERRVFVLRHYEGLSRADIARDTGLTARGVEVRLRQAHQRLRAMQRDRATDPAYALLASLGARSTRSTSLTAAPAVVAAAAAVVLVVRITSVPLPMVTPGRSELRGHGWPPAVARDGRPAAADRVVLAAGDDPLVALSVDQRARESKRLPGIDTCALPFVAAPPACVRAPASGNPRTRGDRLTLQIAGHRVHVEQHAVAVCDHVRDNEVARCERGQGPYVVPDPKEDPTKGAGTTAPPSPGPPGADSGGPKP